MPTVTTIASGAAMMPTSHPPTAGPVRFASCSVDWSLPFASAICAGARATARALWFETSKNTVATPMISATTTRCQI